MVSWRSGSLGGLVTRVVATACSEVSGVPSVAAAVTRAFFGKPEALNQQLSQVRLVVSADHDGLAEQQGLGGCAMWMRRKER